MSTTVSMVAFSGTLAVYVDLRKVGQIWQYWEEVRNGCRRKIIESRKPKRQLASMDN